jgi:hypothetical protein
VIQAAIFAGVIFAVAAGIILYLKQKQENDVMLSGES